jgi:hypothetical protein
MHTIGDTLSQDNSPNQHGMYTNAVSITSPRYFIRNPPVLNLRPIQMASHDSCTRYIQEHYLFIGMESKYGSMCSGTFDSYLQGHHHCRSPIPNSLPLYLFRCYPHHVESRVC